MSGHHVPIGLYWAVFAALLVLTGATVLVAYFDLGVFNTLLALTIAGAKALLVALFFMHLRWSRRLMWVIACSSVLFLAILIGFTLGDYLTRGWLPYYLDRPLGP